MAELLDEKLKHIDQWIVGGRASEARHELRLIAKKPVARESRAHFASLCRRAQLYSISLRVLNPLVRPTGKKVVEPTPHEISEYAACLTYIGATEEASALLSKVSPDKAPQSQLFQAFAFFAEWNYQEAVSPLQSYVQNPSLTDYQRLIGKVNLAAALTYERDYDAAKSLLDELIIDTEKLEMFLLNGNLWEISAQNEIFQSHWDLASKCLVRSMKRLKENKNAGYVFAEKWEVILNALKKPNPSNRQALAIFKNQAQEEELWEVVRDCERYEAIAFRDRELIEKVCFGTPYAAFIRSTEDLWGEKLNLAQKFDWEFSKGDSPVLLDLLSFSPQQRKKGMKSGLALHRLLVSLVRDFYRPSRIAVLHHRLFPNEYYHPISSPKRVHEKIRFLRKWMKSCRLPLSVEQKKKYYFLTAKNPVTLRIFPSTTKTQPMDLRLVKLKNLLPDEPLTTKSVGRALNLSVRSTVRLLSLGVTQGVLEPRGRGRACAYFWKVVLLAALSGGAFSDPYQILGTHPEASSDELKKAYLRKARELHPDVSRLPKEEAEKAFKQLQSAWEAVQKKQTRKGPETLRRDLAQKQAERVLEKAWSENRFGPDTFNELPRWKKAQELSSLSPLHSRGPEEEGEWLAVSNFLRSKQAELLSSQAPVLGGVLERLETYFSLTGQSVQNTRGGLLEPFELAVLKQAKTKEEFLEAFQKRGERLLRTGAFSWGESRKIFSDKFGGALSELEIAQELLQTRFEMIKRSPPTLHEAGFFLRTLSKALSETDQFSFLESFKKQMSFLPREFRRQGAYKDLELRLQQATERLLSKSPEFQKPSSSFLKNLSETCGRVLKRFR